MKYIRILTLLLVLSGCVKNKNERIVKVYLQKKHNNMVSKYNIDSCVRVNDTTLNATYSFMNPLLQSDVKMKASFILKADTVQKEYIRKFYVRSEGEFKQSNLY